MANRIGILETHGGLALAGIFMSAGLAPPAETPESPLVTALSSPPAVWLTNAISCHGLPPGAT